MFRLMILLASLLPLKKNEIYDIVQIKTPQGEIWVWLFDETPMHKKSFIQLAKAGYWDSLTFNRVVPNFVIQGGCPDTEVGFNDPEYLLRPEIVSSIKHEYGSFAAGRDNNPGKISARCQFYIVQNKNGLARLDGNYTIYGKVIRGMEVVEKIAALPRNENDEPNVPVYMDVNIIRKDHKQLLKAGFDPNNRFKKSEK